MQVFTAQLGVTNFVCISRLLYFEGTWWVSTCSTFTQGQKHYQYSFKAKRRQTQRFMTPSSWCICVTEKPVLTNTRKGKKLLVQKDNRLDY